MRRLEEHRGIVFKVAAAYSRNREDRDDLAQRRLMRSREAAAVLLAGSFAGDHAADIRYFVPALLLAVFAPALVVDAAVQITAMRSIDYDEPVLVIQQRLLRVRAQRIKRVARILALAPLMWAPFAIVAIRGLFGIDVYAAFRPRIHLGECGVGRADFSGVVRCKMRTALVRRLPRRENIDGRYFGPLADASASDHRRTRTL